MDSVRRTSKKKMSRREKDKEYTEMSKKLERGIAYLAITGINKFDSITGIPA